MREEALREPATRFLRARGLEVHHEVPIGHRIADIVGLGRELVAVELKLTDWQRGLRQAMTYQLACPRSYLCLPFPRALRLRYKAYYFEREGVGILGCRADGDVRTVLVARPSSRTLPFLGRHLRELLEGDSRSSDLGAVPLRQVGDAPEHLVSKRLEEGLGLRVPPLHQSGEEAPAPSA